MSELSLNFSLIVIPILFKILISLSFIVSVLHLLLFVLGDDNSPFSISESSLSVKTSCAFRNKSLSSFLI